MRLDEKEFLTRLRTLVWRLGLLTTPGETTVEKLREEISEIQVELRNLISLAAPEYDMVTMICEFLNYLSRYTPQLPTTYTETYTATAPEAESTVTVVEEEKDESND